MTESPAWYRNSLFGILLNASITDSNSNYMRFWKRCQTVPIHVMEILFFFNFENWIRNVLVIPESWQCRCLVRRQQLSKLVLKTMKRWLMFLKLFTFVEINWRNYFNLHFWSNIITFIIKKNRWISGTKRMQWF